MSISRSLTLWTQSHFTSIYTAPSGAALQTALNTFFSPHATIQYNAETLSLDDTRARILAQSTAAFTQRIDFQWEKSVEVPDDPSTEFPTGLIGGFYVLTHSSKLRLRAGPMQTLTSVVFNARVEQDPSVEPDEHGDRRRVTFLYETAAISRPPLHLHAVSAQPSDGEKPAGE